MQKARKIVSFLLAMVLILGIAVPVAANERQLPSSFNFEVEFNSQLTVESDEAVPEELGAVIDFVNGVDLSGTGTVVLGENEFFMYQELSLTIPALGTPISLNIWLDVDVNDIENPTVICVIELPAALRLMLGLLGRPELAVQYLVLDMGEIVAEAIPEIERLTAEINEEDFLEQLEAEILEMLNIHLEITADTLEEAIDELIQEFFNLLEETFDEFDLNVDPLLTIYEPNGILTQISAALNFSFFGRNGSDSIGFNFSAGLLVDGIDTATRVPMPTLTPENSTDLIRLFNDAELPNFIW